MFKRENLDSLVPEWKEEKCRAKRKKERFWQMLQNWSGSASQVNAENTTQEILKAKKWVYSSLVKLVT